MIAPTTSLEYCTCTPTSTTQRGHSGTTSTPSGVKEHRHSAEQGRILNEVSAGFGKMPYLFSYGTLQQEEVQLSTFGRQLKGSPDSLVGFLVAEVRIEDSEVIEKSGKIFHPIARKTGAFNRLIPGTVHEITEEN